MLLIDNKATENNYKTFGVVLARMQDIVDAINQKRCRLGALPLVLNDPGSKYCAVSTLDYVQVLWFVDLINGDILGAINGFPCNIAPHNHNIWEEDPTCNMNGFGRLNELSDGPYERKTSRTNINYALEA